MNKREAIKILLVGIGAFLLHNIFMRTAAGTAAEKVAEPTIQITQEEAARERTVAEKIAKKVAEKRIGQPITRAAYIAAAQKKAAQKAAAKRVAGKRIGQPITRAAYIAAAQKKAAQKAIRQETAQKIGKIIGKKVAQKVAPRILEETGGRTGMALVIYLKKRAAAMQVAATQAANAVKTNSKILLPSSKWAGGRTGMALAIYLKKRVISIEQALAQAKAALTRPNTPTQPLHTASKLFPGSERSRIIPYSESSKHSYYGPKSHRLQNEGYGKNKAKRDRKQALEFRLQELRDMFPSSNL